MSRVLLVAGGNPSDWPTIEPATYDYFVGIDRGCLHLLEADLPLQLAVGDFDSLSREEYHFVQETAETLIQAPAEKDDTDTQLALQEALQRFPQAEMTIIGATGGRIDHLCSDNDLISHIIVDNVNHLFHFLDFGCLGFTTIF